MTVPGTHRAAWWFLVVATLLTLTASLVVGRGFTNEDLVIIAFLGYACVGAVIAWQRPANAIGWIFLCIGPLTGLAGLADAGIQAAVEGGPPVAWWGVLSAWYASWFWYPLFMLATTFTFLLFPNGLPSRRWRPVLWLAVAATAAATVFGALAPTLQLQDQQGSLSPLTVPNPISPSFVAGSGSTDNEGGWFLVPLLVGLICGLLAVASVARRTWRARGIERLQMRLFAFAILLVPLQILLAELLPDFGDSFFGNLSFTIALSCIPVACGVAILRYHLYDIDRIIGRTTAYAIVTGLLIGVYAVVVTSVSRLLPGTSSSFAVAAATLAAAALFRPALSRVQAFVDRRFNRSRYDAQRTVEAFAARLRDEVDPDEVTDDLLAVLAQTVQPKAAGLWLREAS